MKKIICLFYMISLSVPILAQVKLLSGDLKKLKDIKMISIKMVYDSIKVDGKWEEDYIAEQKKELNEKETGRGDEWEKKWREDPKARFTPKFNELFYKYSTLLFNETAPFQLVFKTKRIKPGSFNEGLKAYLTGEAYIIDLQTNTVIVRLLLLDMVGKTGGSGWGPIWLRYDAGLRLQESYAKAAKELGQFIAENKK